MRKHLSLRRIARVVANGAAPEEELHLWVCAQCRVAAENLQTAVRNYRESVVAEAQILAESNTAAGRVGNGRVFRF